MEKQVEGGGDSEKREGKKSAPGEGLRRGWGWRRAVTERKGKERWRNERGEARGAEIRKIGEESRRGWEMTGMRTRGWGANWRRPYLRLAPPRSRLSALSSRPHSLCHNYGAVTRPGLFSPNCCSINWRGVGGGR